MEVVSVYADAWAGKYRNSINATDLGIVLKFDGSPTLLYMARRKGGFPYKSKISDML